MFWQNSTSKELNDSDALIRQTEKEAQDISVVHKDLMEKNPAMYPFNDNRN